MGTEPSLDYVLRNLGVENVVVCGFVTDQCVDMAIRDGADRGYYMVCAEDACAAYTEERHAAALKAFGGYCRTQSVDEIMADIIKGAGELEQIDNQVQMYAGE